MTAATFLDRYQALSGRLPGDSALRAAAAEAFRASGLPGGTRQRRTEAWKYTSLRPIAEASFQAGAAPRHEAETILAGLALLDAPRIVFVDGLMRPDLSVGIATADHASVTGNSPPPVTAGISPARPSTPPPSVMVAGESPTPTVMAGEGPPSTASPPHLTIARFADEPDFGTLSWPDREPMVALNTMLAQDGATLHVQANHDAGILQLISIATTDADFHPRHTIRLDPGANLTLLEVSAGQGTYLLNTVAEIHVAKGARLTHIRLQQESPTAFHVSTTYADIAATGTYDSFTLTLGANLSRTEVHAALNGPAATVHLNAAQILSGTQHADYTSVVSHAAPACASRQTVKSVLAGRSKGVFQGKIAVARDAQKTDGYQMNQALLLSPEAEIDSKPELEIFADDVKCSHGATVGELDADQMFYLRARGIPAPEARSILVRAFLAEALDAVADETIRYRLETAVEQYWKGQPA